MTNPSRRTRRGKKPIEDEEEVEEAAVVDLEGEVAPAAAAEGAVGVGDSNYGLETTAFLRIYCTFFFFLYFFCM